MAAAQHLKLWEGMLGKQVAGSPWSNAISKRTKPHQLSACSPHQCKKNTKNIKIRGKIGEKLGGTPRRESNPGLLSEGRGAADRQKC